MLIFWESNLKLWKNPSEAQEKCKKLRKESFHWISLNVVVAPEECPADKTNCSLKTMAPVGFNAQGQVCSFPGTVLAAFY